MIKVQHPQALLGLDVGGINSRVSLMGIAEGRYHLLGSDYSPTSIGQGMHIGSGVGQAMQDLQQHADHLFLSEAGDLLMPVDRIGRGLDRIGMVLSAGERISTALVGLSARGSLKAARALIDALPIRCTASLDLTRAMDEVKAIQALVEARSEILIITGGEDQGAGTPILRWLEIVRTVNSLLPAAAQPVILYAGNPSVEPDVRRCLERVANLHIVPNLQPAYDDFDLVPAQGFLVGEILRAYQTALPGLKDLFELTNNWHGLNAPNLERMMRFLSQTKAHHPSTSTHTGLMAIDLGGVYTTLSAGQSGKSGAVMLDKFSSLDERARIEAAQAICDWASEPVSLEEADQYLWNHAMHPGWIPETRRQLMLSLALTRFRIRQALKRMAMNHSWLDYHPERGLQGYFEPIIASGAVLTQSPDPVGVLLTLLDGFQPHEITTLVLDRHHLLPILGKFAEVEPVLPVHLLSSAAFENLGTVISAVGNLPQGKTALTVHVETQSGKIFSTEVRNGTLNRLDVPQGEAAMLELDPHRRVKIGFGEQGQGGRLKVIGGILGVVIDARGRPLRLAEKAAARHEQHGQWLQMLDSDRGETGDS